LRQGPAPTFDIIQVLNQGDSLNLLGRNESGTWAQVRTTGGLQGWVYAPLIQTNTSMAGLPATGSTSPTVPSGPTAVVSNAIYALNVRSGPGVSFAPITAVTRGQTVELIGRNNFSSWLKIRLANGTEGWSSANYLITNYNLNALPILN
ncbi:MAG: SH3 domain-containing protein, partial [Nitrospirales bacterium]|nr:SH3 domain-containing protein [Nitrospirales bacterium]